MNNQQGTNKNIQEMLAKYRSRLVKEAIIKSFMLGLVIGFSVLVLSSTIWWFFGLKFFWLCIVFFGVSVGATTPILYLIKFNPTIKYTARRVDALGLEERAITMTDYEHDNSYIATRQRRDAAAHLRAAKELSLKIVVSLSLVIILGISALTGFSMISVAALTESGTIKSGLELIDNHNRTAPKEINIIYEIEGEGDIDGEMSQVIKQGEECAPVMAIPSDNWMFVGWSDGHNNPYRLDTPNQDIILTAYFEEMPIVEEEDSLEDFLTYPSSTPSDSENTDDGESGGGEGGVSAYEKTNMIIDGETYYGGPAYDAAYNDAMNELSENNYSSQEESFIEEYFRTIARD